MSLEGLVRKLLVPDSMGLRSLGAASGCLGDFLDGGPDSTQKVIAATSALLVVAVGASVNAGQLGGTNRRN
jgi:hypothetical protein